MLKNYPDVMTVKQVAQVLKIGINKAYELVNQQIIGSIKVGRRTIVPKLCLIDFLLSARYRVNL